MAWPISCSRSPPPAPTCTTGSIRVCCCASGRHKSYLVGVVCQFSGFLLAFLARRDLPLFLVQSAVAAGLGVTAILGVVILKWKLPRSEVILLVLLCLGLAALVIAARPSPSRQLGPAGVDRAAAHARGHRGGRVLRGPHARRRPARSCSARLAGVAFGAAAVASRPLASANSFGAFVADPLLYLLLAHSVVGQLLSGLAMQRGSTTAAVAAMDAAAAVPAAIVGLLFLGDGMQPGREWLVAFGFVMALGGVIGLSFYAEPQHHHARATSSRRTDGRSQLGASTMPKAPFASSVSNSPAGTARAKWKP